MNKLKKMFAVLLSVTTIGGVSVTASAKELFPLEERNVNLRNYHQCDINRDGVVNDTDWMTLIAYLEGMRYVPNYNLLDANRNLIVDWADVEYIINYLFGVDTTQKFVLRNYNTTSNSLTETTIDFPDIGHNIVNDGVSWQTSSICYWKYDYDSGTSSNYWLSPSLQSINSGSGTRGTDRVVDGFDDRYSTTLPENAGIVKISCSGADGTSTGTGFIVDDGIIATAAHVVEEVKNGGTLTITLHNQDGTLSATNLTPIEIHIPYDYVNGYSTLSNDYALISVSEDLSSYPKFVIGNCYSLNLSVFSDVPIYVTGNPGIVYAGTDHEVNNRTDWLLYSNVGNVVSSNDESMIYFDTDSTSGDSGSPIYTITRGVNGNNFTYYYTALGTVYGEGGSPDRDSGVRFTKYHQRFYLSNPNVGFGD